MDSGEDNWWRDVFGDIETEEVADFRSDEDGEDDDDETDDRVADAIDSGFYFVVFPSGKDEHHSSPDDEDDGEESRNEDYKGNPDSYDIVEFIYLIGIDDGSGGEDYFYHGDIKGKESK